LVPSYGVLGAAWSLAGSIFGTFVLSQYLLKRELGTSVIGILGRIAHLYIQMPNKIFAWISQKR
jgi:hypothetical protein